MLIKLRKLTTMMGIGLVAIILISAAVGYGLKIVEKDKVKARGVMVEVDNKNMHVSSSEKTIATLNRAN